MFVEIVFRTDSQLQSLMKSLHESVPRFPLLNQLKQDPNQEENEFYKKQIIIRSNPNQNQTTDPTYLNKQIKSHLESSRSR